MTTHPHRSLHARIRAHLGHGEGARRVRVHGVGIDPYPECPWVEYYGSTDPFERQHDYWHYAGEVDRLAEELPPIATYTVVWVDSDGCRQLPGCSEAEASFGSEEAAHEAIAALRDDPDWADADLRIEVTR